MSLRQLKLTVRSGTGEHLNDPTYFLICVEVLAEDRMASNGKKKWGVHRQYNEFKILRDYMLKLLRKQVPEAQATKLRKTISNLPFPTTDRINTTDANQQIGDRKLALQDFLNNVVALCGQFTKLQEEKGICTNDESNNITRVLSKFIALTKKREDDHRSASRSPKRSARGVQDSMQDLALQKSSSSSSSSSRSRSAYSSGSSANASSRSDGPKSCASAHGTSISSGSKSRTVRKFEQEMGKVLSREDTTLLMRFLDRLVSRALVKAAGCYRVTHDNIFVLDSMSFYEEFEVAFPKIASELQPLFAGKRGEWITPKSVHRYLNRQWRKFTNDEGSSEDSESEAAFEYLAGERKSARIKSEKEKFSEEQLQELELMNANGTIDALQRRQLTKHYVDRRKTWDDDDEEDDDGDDDDNDDDDDEDSDLDFTQDDLYKSKQRSRRY